MIRALPCVLLVPALFAQSTIEALLKKPILDPRQPLIEVQNFTASRVAMMSAPRNAQEWQAESARIRKRVLDEIVFRGEARKWREAKTRVEFLESVDSEGYRFRKLRYEVIPGLWVPAVMYEPLKLAGRVPAVLNVNGHEKAGIATPYIQKRCIHLARNGVVALNPEWFGRGQLSDDNFNHYRMPQLDLTGTSGLALFYLAESRALDILAAHASVDPNRIAVTGLSGGGWQTVMLSSLDTRVSLSNPVAGHSSYITRTQFPELDLGDSEQTPSDLASVADYTHLTSMIAPRPLQLSFNAKDNCCFRADYAGGPMMQAARNVFAALNQPGRFRYHLNHDPGHNYEYDNRQAFYRFLGEHFFDGRFSADEKPATLRGEEELKIALPPDNKTLHSIATELSRDLPRAGKPSAARLREVARVRDYKLRAELVTESKQPDLTVRFWRLHLDDSWTVPVTDFVPDGASGTALVVADNGRASAAAEIDQQLKLKRRVAAMDPFYFGESKIVTRDFLFSMLVAGVGERPLGVQASQVIAAANWMGKDTRVIALGPRIGVAAHIAAAVNAGIGALETQGSFRSLKEILTGNLTVDKQPELFCFGLLEEYDLPQMQQLIAPRQAIMR